ncbi:hypothetical protein M2475_001828 [Breznakia sp. PF5-3]|uniref:hypothetical protein n=1 Tax=unclassified Breznakia TaxID=2623764 RepID=UPI00240697EE|nr:MULTISPECIES: hypothetical protein [unclassified Breznakia]MDF9825373.1 hypothetical protein [Breznakia sp. PM6-1]MDF9836251.1 hypothetical protein [Breznakia sp. PF5-3]MDF9838509.1 hypothetical protein [Breznakia sp. PFB2-8]MDF9860496.1 hypothetical protein [Breznakia sp. PH5-24]
MRFRITKYNPEYRADNGAYTVDDWISVGEIGKVFNGTKLSLDTYLGMEKNYLDSINIIFKTFNCKNIVVKKWRNMFLLKKLRKIYLICLI